MIVATVVVDLFAVALCVVGLQHIQVHDHNKFLFNHLVNWSMMHLPKDKAKPMDNPVGGVPPDPALVMKKTEGPLLTLKLGTAVKKLCIQSGKGKPSWKLHTMRLPYKLA